jgi:phosphatidate cytidylyltransferase
MDAQAAIAARFLAIALALFVVAALLIGLAGLLRGPAVAHRLVTAYLTEFAILAVVIVPAYIGTAALTVTVVAMCAIGTSELYRARAHGDIPRLTWIGIAAGLTVPLTAALASQAVLFDVLLVGAIVMLAAGLEGQAGKFASSPTVDLAGLIYPNAFGACLLLVGRAQGGFGLIAFLVGIVELNDSCAMLGGLLVGGPKIWPRLSPNKTVAGSCVGLLAALGGALALAFAVPSLALPQVFASGLVVGIAAQLGDLVASAIKRGAGVKDFSTWIPGAGGILDMYDGLIFAAPVFWLYLQVVGGV